MGADFYTIAHFNVTFIGSNLPKSSIVSAAKELKPDFIGISVTNYLRLAKLRGIIESLRENVDRKLPLLSAVALSTTPAALHRILAQIN